jgi:hypothetical protein
MEAQTSYEKYITFCINILGPQLLHHLVRNSVLAHSSLEGQPTNQQPLAVLHQLNYVYHFQILLLPAIGRPEQVRVPN